MGRDDAAAFGAGGERRTHDVGRPGPLVSKPELRDEVQRRGGGAAIVCGDACEQIGRRALRVLDDDIEVFIVCEEAGVQNLEFGIEPGSRGILVDQPAIRKGPLRILVEGFHVRVRRHVVEVVVQLLDILAVIALMAAKAEKALLEDRVRTVPERRREAQPLVAVADPEDAVFAPAVRSRARLLERKIIPRVAIATVIFANRPPLPIAEIGTP